MREASFFVGVLRRKERAGEVGMPAEALHLVGARVHGDGSIDCGLVQRFAVEARHTANSHWGVAQVLVGFRGFLLQRLQCGEWRGPGVQACALKTVEAHDLGYGGRRGEGGSVWCRSLASRLYVWRHGCGMRR